MKYIVVFLPKSNSDFWKMGMKNWNKKLHYFGTTCFYLKLMMCFILVFFLTKIMKKTFSCPISLKFLQQPDTLTVYKTNDLLKL